ncbi:MAG: thioredoxin family protein [Bacteroidales bacterium]|jgi:thioredoxin-related protein|nr:thioredoxin family protein [Bacteroidales bacterium]MDD4214541.1 thioredoxin family protein [Bacteroidales bacterium]
MPNKILSIPVYFTFKAFKVLMLCFAIQVSAQTSEPENTGLVKWMDLKTAQELNKTQPKPIIIDVYTDWCGWCKHMMKTTFSNPNIANYINTYFYPVRYNAETKDTVEFLDKKYTNKNTGNRSPNDFSIMLLEGKLSYPTIVFYNNNYKFKLLSPGYMSPKDIEPLLVYTVEYIFNTTQVNDFRDYYNKAFYPDSGFVSNDTIKWLKSFEEASINNKKKKRKTILFINTNWCNGGKVMLRSTFNNSSVTSYMKENFNTVFFDAQTHDTITYNNQKFVNAYDNQGFHPLFQHLLGQQIVLPSLLFFDEDMKLLSNVGQYLTPESLDPILHYFAENHYLTKKWEDYIKELQNK